MGIVSFSAEKFGPASSVRGALVSSGSHTSAGTASNLTDGASGGGSAVTFIAGDVLTIFTDTALWLAQGDQAAAASDGHYVPANIPTNLSIYATGTISVIE